MVFAHDPLPFNPLDFAARWRLVARDRTPEMRGWLSHGTDTKSAL